VFPKSSFCAMYRDDPFSIFSYNFNIIIIISVLDLFSFFNIFLLTNKLRGYSLATVCGELHFLYT
jgi:hypothetical protein